MDDWTISAGGLTVGAGTNYQLTQIGGVGGRPSTRQRTSERGDKHGEVAGLDALSRRSITIGIEVEGNGSPSDAWTRYQSLTGAWAPSSTDQPLDIAVPGMGSSGRRFFGRFDRIEDDGLVTLQFGFVRCLASFEALDPLGYGPEETAAAQSGTFSITNSGTAPTDRIEITINGNGGTPALVDPDDASRAIRFGTAVSGTRTINVRSRTVMNGATDAYSELSATNQWLDLAAGSNTLTLIGATSVDVTWRPAWF